MKYHILQDWGTDGYSLNKEEYETVNDAVVATIAKNLPVKFLIIQIIDWEAKEKTGVDVNGTCNECGSESAHNWEGDSLDEHTNND